MTVSELISVLQEMDGTDVIVIGQQPGNDVFNIATGPVYSAIVDIDDEPHNAVVIEADS